MLHFINISNKLCFLLFVVFVTLFAVDGFNEITYQSLGYDEAYNATVAANFVRYGEYRVSYPDNIIFHNIITTGVPVLIPTAFVFYFWGINHETSSVIALVYSIMNIVLLWYFIRIVLGKITNKNTVLATFLTIFLIISNNYYFFLSTHLLGEIACVTFLFCGFLCFYHYFEDKNIWCFLGVGFFFVTAFLTKSSTIFFLFSLLGITILESFITKTIKKEVWLPLFLGILLAFLLIDGFKLFQLGTFSNYLDWWLAEFKNMSNQSGGEKVDMWDKILYLSDIFGCSWEASIILISYPIFFYIFHIFNRFSKNPCSTNPTLVIMGVSGVSLIVYFILFGDSGLVYARRHAINVFFIRVTVLIHALITVILYYRKQHNYKYIFIILLVSLVSPGLITVDSIKNNINSLFTQRTEKDYGYELMSTYLTQVSKLPKSATLYTMGWWQEPNVTLFLDRKMTNAEGLFNGSRHLTENCYLLIGHLINDLSKKDAEEKLNVRLIRINNIEVDYDKLSYPFDHMDYLNYSIYSIKKCSQ